MEAAGSRFSGLVCNLGGVFDVSFIRFGIDVDEHVAAVEIVRHLLDGFDKQPKIKRLGGWNTDSRR